MNAAADGGRLEPAARELEEARLRRNEVEQRLSRAGLKRVSLDRAPRWLEPVVQARLRSFRDELQALGPVFRFFGRYLGTRLDLLHGSDARDLSLLADDAEPVPARELTSLLRSEIGPRAAALVHLDEAATESSALSQTHRGSLADGRRVLVKFSRTTAQSEHDLAILPHLAEYLSSLGWPLPSARRVLRDFSSLVTRRKDLGRAAEVLLRFADLPGEPRLLSTRVVEGLSSGRVLTIEVPEGTLLFPPPSARGSTDDKSLGAARIVTDLWMGRVFDDAQIPEEMSRGEIWSSPGGGVLISGGLFHPISSGEADALRSYLVAAGRDDPDEVFHALKRLTESTNVADAEALRHHLGHVVPRRDGRFGEEPPGFPEFLLSHWRQLERHGLVPCPALLAFYRGVVSLRDLTGPALSHQVLKEGVQVVQISHAHQRLRKAFDPSRMGRWAESLVKTLMDLPRKLERDRRSPAAPSAEPAGTEVPEARARETGDRNLAIGLLLAATLLLWLLRFPTLLGPWTAPVQALTLAALGLGLFRLIWNR